MNCGFDVIVRHAVSTSMFLSLFCVFGKLDPLHITNGVPPFSPVAFLRKGANGISHDAPLPSISAPGFSLAAGDAPAFCTNAEPWTKLDCPPSAIAFDSCSFVFGHWSVLCPGGCADGLWPAVDGLPSLVFAVPAGDDDDVDSEGVRVACDTGEIALGGVASSAWKSAADVLFVPRKFPPNNWSSASCPPLCESDGVQW